jgi:hypothetical protein
MFLGATVPLRAQSLCLHGSQATRTHIHTSARAQDHHGRLSLPPPVGLYMTASPRSRTDGTSRAHTRPLSSHQTERNALSRAEHIRRSSHLICVPRSLSGGGSARLCCLEALRHALEHACGVAAVVRPSIWAGCLRAPRGTPHAAPGGQPTRRRGRRVLPIRVTGGEAPPCDVEGARRGSRGARRHESVRLGA